MDHISENLKKFWQRYNFTNNTKVPKLTSIFDIKKTNHKQIIFYTYFPIKEQVHFAKRLAFLVGAGVPILNSLYLLRDQTKSRSRKAIYDQMIDDLTNGLFLSTSLAKFERFFGTFAINIIKIGETGGELTQNLNYLADELRKKEELRKKIIGSLIYPILITVATLLLSGMLTVFIFPKIMPIFQSLNVSLPITTIILLNISNFLINYGLHLIFIFFLTTAILHLLNKYWLPCRYLISITTIHLPIFGRMSKYYHMSNFCRTLGLLLKSGVNIVESVSITGETMSNVIYQKHCQQLTKAVIQGKRISTYLIKHPKYFPDFTAHLVAVGEETGSLSDTLLYLSDMYETEVSDITKNLSNSIEPILMILMGLIVGFVAVSVITPIYEVTQHLNP